VVQELGDDSRQLSSRMRRHRSMACVPKASNPSSADLRYRVAGTRPFNFAWERSERKAQRLAKKNTLVTRLYILSHAASESRFPLSGPALGALYSKDRNRYARESDATPLAAWACMTGEEYP